MIKMLTKYFLSFCLFGLGFGQVDYTEIQTIFTNNCGSCHLENSSGGLNLSSYTDLMSGSSEGAVVIPYDHASSAIYDRITREESAAGDMPPSGSLSTNDIDLIAQWIDEGALEEPGSSSGCTDPEAYNCADDNWSCYDEGGEAAECMDAGEWPNYTVLVGTTPYINGCNYDNTDPLDGNLPVYQGGCESGPCEGFYNPGATTDDGSCDYYQAPHGDHVEFSQIELFDNEWSVTLDWTSWANNFVPANAEILGYYVARCIGDGCTFITASPFPWGSNDGYNSTTIVDDNGFEWESSDGEIKYSINVKYSNAEEYGMAIGVSYLTPESCPALGDINGDGGWNVLDIVTLANCVLAGDCADLENNCAGDLNGDGGYNVLDIVTLANCVLAGDCG